MKDRALVTLAIGRGYSSEWKRICAANWREYADRFGYDLICLDQPLDTSERARKRSPAWQKCLVLGHPQVRDYDRVVWIDSDILINTHHAPDILEGVPPDRVGGVEDIGYSHTEPLESARFMERVHERWPDGVVNRTANEYYTKFGLPDGCDSVVNTGVLALSPRHHRDLLEYVYHHYEEKGGREWHMEMRPLSYELVTRKLVHWIDPRFNLMWPYLEMMYYPGAQSPRTPTVFSRMRRLLETPVRHRALRWSVNAAFQLAFFLHFGGPNTELMSDVDGRVASWAEVTF